jgi:hypothetical protein
MSLSVMTGFGLGDDSIPGKGKDFSLRHRDHTGSLSYRVPYPMGTGGKAAGA